MSQTDQPNPRHRRGGRAHSHHRSGQSQSRSGGQPRQSQNQNQQRSGRGDRVPREDHRDWEPVDRNRDIRRRAAERPGLFQRLLSLLTFGRFGGKKKTAGRSAAASSGRDAKAGRSPDPRQPKVQRESRQSTAPDPDAVTSPRLHVGNLNYEAAESDLTGLFRGIGQVQSVEIVYHRDTQRSKGFGFVQMLTVEEAKRAVVELHGKDFMGRKMEIGPARHRDAQAPASDRRSRSDRRK